MERLTFIKDGTKLYTKDGRKIGNAAITEFYYHLYLNEVVVKIKTDYGNTAILTGNELDKLFYLEK